jgi:hypothetical protein
MPKTSTITPAMMMIAAFTLAIMVVFVFFDVIKLFFSVAVYLFRAL